MMRPTSSPVFRACGGLDEEESVFTQIYQNQGAVSFEDPILMLRQTEFIPSLGALLDLQLLLQKQVAFLTSSASVPLPLYHLLYTFSPVWNMLCYVQENIYEYFHFFLSTRNFKESSHFLPQYRM